MTRIAIILITTLVCCSLLWCANEAPAADHTSYCSGMYNCLQEIPIGCSKNDCKQQTNIHYSDEYCEIFKNLHARGLRSTSSQGRQIYQKVSGRHLVEYAKAGTLPMPEKVITYLMNNLPFAAHLVNAYQDTNFEAVYLDRNKNAFPAQMSNCPASSPQCCRMKARQTRCIMVPAQPTFWDWVFGVLPCFCLTLRKPGRRK